jgi:hypothetical protein
MRRLTWLTLVSSLAVALLSCVEEPTVRLEAMRLQPPLVRLEGRPVSVGILLVHAEDELLETTRPDLWNVSALVVKAVRDSLASMGGQVEVVDYTRLGFRMWERERSKAELRLDPEGLTLDAWPGVPPEVTTSLVTVVKVVRWEVSAAHPDGTGVGFNMALLLSTWTPEGQPVSTQMIRAIGRTGEPLLLRSREAAVELYEELRRPHHGPLPEEWTEAFWVMLRELVGLHYFPLLPHRVAEQLTLVGSAEDEGLRALRAGREEDALAVWRGRYERHPEDHGALYNAARVHALRGNDRQALQLLLAARAVKDAPLYQEAWRRVQQRVSRSWPPESSRPGDRPPTEGTGKTASTQCFLHEQAASSDIRWTQGLSLDIGEERLREYHPEQCGWPGVRCSIDFYQVKWFVGIWSERFFPGQNDIDRKLNYDGTQRRMWSSFYDHTHRYRYCVHRVRG